MNFYRTHTENHKYALALAFSIYEINMNPDILPNMSLIFEFSVHNCVWESKLMSFMHVSLQNYDIFPNYLCKEYTKCAMALTSLNWATTVKFNTILNNFISQQVSVCVCVCVCVFIEAEWEFCHEIIYLLVPA
jgi:vomeronasal 2 receptor